MVDVKATAIRLYRRYFGSPAAAQAHARGAHVVMNGADAVTLSEATLTQSIVLDEQDWPGDDTINTFGEPIAVLRAEGARGAMASAMGLAMSGRRASLFLDGQEIAGTQDLLFAAAGRHLPLVVHLTNRALSGHGGTQGSGHEGFHLASDTGCFTLFARNVQEAVDFTYIARRVAERCLIPGLVSMDDEQTAGAVQDVHLLAAEQIREFIGAADDLILVPTVAQRMLLGRERRRVPRWHDLDRPALQGAGFDRDNYVLGAVGRQAFFDEYLSRCLDEALADFVELTGRRYDAVSKHRTDDADVVFVVQGSAVETATTAVETLRERRVKAGVLGIGCLRPFPLAETIATAGPKRAVVVLERLLPPPGVDGPLTREIRFALGGRAPLCHTVSYGVGGAPLRLDDLLAIPGRLNASVPSRFVLGVDFLNEGRSHPKREVLLDGLRRAYPDLESAGLRATSRSSSAPAGCTAIAFSGKAIGELESMVSALAGVLHAVEGRAIRSRLDPRAEGWGVDGSHELVIAEGGTIVDTGDDGMLDLLVVADGYGVVDEHTVERLQAGGAVLIAGSGQNPYRRMTAEAVSSLQSKNARIFTTGAAGHPEPEYVVGAAYAVLQGIGGTRISARKFVSSRQDRLREENLARRDREALAEMLQQGIDGCVEVDPATLADAVSSRPRWDESTPAAVRMIGRTDNEFDSLPRFWDQVGVLFNNGESRQLTPDPYLATGTVAPLSSTFRHFDRTRECLPSIDSELCTGCGKCWTTCPDSAIGAVAIGPGALTEAGMKIAGADALRQVSGQLATRMAGQAKKGELAQTAGDAFREEFAWMKEKMSLTPEREEALSGAIESIADRLGNLPLAVTEPFFTEAENRQKDSGELLSLVVNPDACKGCGICVDQCEPQAISLIAQDEATLGEARARWNTFAALPDTSAATIERVVEEGTIDSLAAVNTSRYCADSLAGGDSAEAGSGEKIALRMVLAATEFYAQPLLNRFAHDVQEAAQALVEGIQDRIASAIPGDDLEVLHKALDQVESPRTELSVLAQRIESAAEARQLDAAGLKRVTGLAGQLVAMHETIVEGRQGFGRARYGLAFTPGTAADWAGEFPYNSFQAPVVIDSTGETASVAAGLLEGHLRETCEAVALLRTARLESERPGGMEFERESIRKLEWRDLTEEERRTCPPLLLIGSDEILSGAALSQVLWLLSSDLPVKVVVLSELDFGIAAKIRGARHHDPRANLAQLALAARHGYVAQTSIGNAAHMFEAVSGTLKYSGPSLLRIHVPSPSRHGFPADRTVRQAALATVTRANPLFIYDPRRPGVYGARLSLDGNVDPKLLWADVEGARTFAEWAYTEQRFQHHFSEAAEDASTVPVEEYLAMDAPSRSGKTPVLLVRDREEEDQDGGEDEEQEARRVAVSLDLIRAMEDQRDCWQMLQELAGEVTPFTDKVRDEAEQEVAARHQEELDTLKSEYEQKMSTLTTEVKQEVAGRIRGQLVKLVRMKNSDVTGQGG